MKIIVTGANGQLGREIRDACQSYPNHQFVFTDAAELDITDKEQVKKFYERETPHMTINCAAYTQVDKAESDKDKAYAVNCLAVQYLVRESELWNIPFIHISTDYVFDGKSYCPYSETSPISPISVYGTTKAQGEQVVLNYKLGVVIRTSWVYSFYGNNFVKSILRLARERPTLNIVYDQIGSPTSAFDLADVLMLMVEKIAQDTTGHYSGLYQFSNEGICSWYDFGVEIVKQSQEKCKVLPIPTTAYPTPAKRPHYTVMDKTKIKKYLNIEIPYWRESLLKCLKRLRQ